MNERELSAIPVFLREAWEEMEHKPDALEHAMDLFEPTPKDILVPSVSGLLAKIETAPMRHAPFFRRVAEMFEISEQEVEKLLGPNDWKKAPMPGIRFKEVPGVQNQLGQSKTLVQFSARTRFPHHGHDSRERLLILEGGYTDDQGNHFGPGDLHDMAPGSEHGFVIDADGPCIAASLADAKIQFTSFWMRSLAKLVGR